MKYPGSLTKEEQEIVDKLLRSISFNDTRNIVTNFLTSFEQMALEKIVSYNYQDLKIEFFGGYVQAEKKKAKIIANEYYDIDYDIVCLKADYNNKFTTLRHKDVMGAAYNLGVNTNRIGDIVVEDSSVYIFVDSAIADFISMNLNKIGRLNLEFSPFNYENLSFKQSYEEFEIVSSSFRIDAIVAKITNKSRSKVKEMLEKELIKLNHVVINSGEKLCSSDDLLSVRKYGRYKIKESSQNKKSLKYRIKIQKTT